ncbi:MAG: hypothetical protein AAF629_32660 [Chloroflexota bacterium]
MTLLYCPNMSIRAIVFLISVAYLGYSLVRVASAEGPVNQNSLDRPYEPIVIQGSALPILWGTPADQVRLYVYQNNQWLGQVPVQIDERDASGNYTAMEDGLFDANDEVIFMTADLGDQAPDPFSLRNTFAVSATIYTIQVYDRLDNAQQGWAYLVRSIDEPISFSPDYVTYVTETNRFSTTQYALGYADTHLGLDWLALGASDVNLLDRSKLRVLVSAGIFGEFTITEADIGAPAGGEPKLILDGPVRALVERGVRVDDDDVVIDFQSVYAAYNSVVQGVADLSVSAPALDVENVSTTLDFSTTVIAGRLYNQNIPGGVAIDGQPDVGVASDLSTWFQLSHPTGRLVQVADPSGMGTDPQTFYKDDETISNGDTGDKKAFGEIGFFIEEGINLTSTVRSTLYMLPPASGGSDNVGVEFEQRFSNPLAVTLSSQTAIDSVALTGNVTGLIAGMYTFTATVNPINATQPITYLWQASETPAFVQTNGASDQATFYWLSEGTKTVTVTTSNAVSQIVKTHTLTIEAPFNQPAIAPEAILITGPTVGASLTKYVFTATVKPISTTAPLLFTWQASDLEAVVHSNMTSDTVVFTWPTTGTKVITARAQNGTAIITGTHIVGIDTAGFLGTYLPVILK